MKGNYGDCRTSWASPLIPISYHPALPPIIPAATNAETMWQLFKEFLLFLKQEKKWWLVPLITVLLLVGALIVFAGSSPLAPFIYPLF